MLKFAHIFPLLSIGLEHAPSGSAAFLSFSSLKSALSNPSSLISSTIMPLKPNFLYSFCTVGFLNLAYPAVECKDSRSEERRVGKECSSVWSPEHSAKEVRNV